MSRLRPRLPSLIRVEGHRDVAHEHAPERRHRSVRDEVRANLIAALATGDPLFPGIRGYDDTIIPQVVNALLARQDFIVLGLRGQAKSRLLRSLTGLLDEHVDVGVPVPGHLDEDVADHGLVEGFRERGLLLGPLALPSAGAFALALIAYSVGLTETVEKPADSRSALPD